MKIEKGTSRIAIVGEHATLKIPQPKIRTAIKAIQWAIKRGYLKRYLSDDEKHLSISQHLLKGWLENLREWRLSREINGIVVPTRFSIFGLINIQDTAQDVELEFAKIGGALTGKLPPGTLLQHGAHTIGRTDNFGQHEGKLKLRDYGELGLEYLLRNYREQLIEAFAETMAKIQAR